MLTCPIADVLFGGARGGGKTDSLLGAFVAHASRSNGWARGIIFRRSTPELEEVIARSKQIYPMLGAYWLEGKKTWFFLDGATLKMRWLDRDEDADRYQGHSYDFIGIDELGTWKDEAPIDKLRATLRSAHGIPCVMRATANPGGPGHHWIKKRYIDPAPPLTAFYDEKKFIWRVFIPSKLTDNRILNESDPGYMDRIRASGPEWLVRAWLDGDWNASAPRGGVFVLRNGDPFIDYVPTNLVRIVRGWDFAATEKRQGNDPDWTVGVKIGVDAEGVFYLLDVVRIRGAPDEVERLVMDTARMDGYGVEIRFPLDPGQASRTQVLVYTRKLAGYIVSDLPESGDKVQRAGPVASQYNVGNLKILRNPDWNEDFMEEIKAFPQAPKDDQVDALSQAFSVIGAEYPAFNITQATLDAFR